MLKKLVCIVCLLPVFLCAESVSSLGHRLTTMFWTDIKEHNNKKLEQYFSPDFQVVSTIGPLTRKESLDFLKKAKVKTFSFNRMRTTRYKDRLVVTYGVEYRATTTGVLVKGFGPQVNVWKKTHDRWMLVATGDISVEM